MTIEKKIQKIRNWTTKKGNYQREIAKALGISDARLSDALNVEGFTAIIDKALEYIEK